MSSARPRLVEEGEPIAFANHHDGRNYDDDHHEISGNRNVINSFSPTNQNKHGNDHQRRPTGSSSLQQAASSLQRAARQTRNGGVGGTDSTRRRSYGGNPPTKTFTSYVIGGERTTPPVHAHESSGPTHLHSAAIIGGNTYGNSNSNSNNSNSNDVKYSSNQFIISSPNEMSIATQAHPCHHNEDEDDAMIDCDLIEGETPMMNPHQRHPQQQYPPQRRCDVNAGAQYPHFHQQQHEHHYGVSTPRPSRMTQTSFEIGAAAPPLPDPVLLPHPSHALLEDVHRAPAVDRMEGVEDHSEKAEIVVLDGANVAYAYTDAKSSSTPSLTAAAASSSPSSNRHHKKEPDVQGIRVAVDYFLQHGIRVLVVLPLYFWRSKPRPGDPAAQAPSSSFQQQMEILEDLQARRLMVPSPPADDDDAYAITIARREDAKSQRYPERIAPGYVLSNDMFRDAQERDAIASLTDSSIGDLKTWLQKGRVPDHPGRISYTFFDNHSMNDRGEPVLDFQPNPRHPLIMRIERQRNNANA